MKIKIFIIFVLLSRSNCGVFGFKQTDASEVINDALNLSYRPTRFIDNFIDSVGNQFTNFLSGKISATSNKISNMFEGYYAARNEMIKAENNLMTGADMSLNELESKVDDMFMTHKLKELSFGQNNTHLHAAGLHFFKAKSIIEKSKVFRFLKKMPKGAILHLHSSASVSSEWVVRNISYMPGLLRCTNKYGVSILTFRQSTDHGCTTSYISVKVERERSFNSSIYDAYFERLINLYTPDPEVAYPSIDHVWSRFQNMFLTMGDALDYIDAYRAYHWQMLKEMYEDNIMYAEIRTNFHELYELNGKKTTKEQSVKVLIDVVKQFCQQYPTFLGIKVIYATQRGADVNKTKSALKEFQSLQAKFPDFIVGYDLVGQEDKGKPLINLVEHLQQTPSSTFFFHAGETNRYGTSTDLNLFDAILLNTKRIGHGYMLMKHPMLRSIVRSRQIAVEVCPLSNQVLHLTADLRNHPAGNFLAEDLPLVISSDDPGFWNAKGLSYDFYYAIMSFASKQSGLKVLKALVLNSLKFSAISNFESHKAIANWERDWTIFLMNVLNGKVF